MSTVEAYQEAYRLHAAAHKRASAVVQEIHNNSNAIGRDLRSFMGWQFNIQIDNRRERFDPKAQVDLAKWPSADDLRLVLSDWNDADTALRQTWAALSDEDRAGLRAPPSNMHLDISRY